MPNYPKCGLCANEINTQQMIRRTTGTYFLTILDPKSRERPICLRCAYELGIIRQLHALEQVYRVKEE